MICDICGTKMKHYEAGEEWRCPNRGQHAKIQSQKRPGNVVIDPRQQIPKKKRKH